MRLMTVSLLALALSTAATAAEPPVAGAYRGNGKDAKLAYAVAVPHEDFNGKHAITIVLTEQPPKTTGDPSISASFGKYGSALVVSILENGSVFGCEVAHQALKHAGASSIGKLAAEDFKWGNGEVSAHLTTHGKASLFEESWEVDLTFKVKAP